MIKSPIDLAAITLTMALFLFCTGCNKNAPPPTTAPPLASEQQPPRDNAPQRDVVDDDSSESSPDGEGSSSPGAPTDAPATDEVGTADKPANELGEEQKITMGQVGASEGELVNLLSDGAGRTSIDDAFKESEEAESRGEGSRILGVGPERSAFDTSDDFDRKMETVMSAKDEDEKADEEKEEEPTKKSKAKKK